MAYVRQPDNRLAAIGATLGIHALLAAGLIWGLSFAASVPEPREALPSITVSVDLPPQPPPPPPVENTAEDAPAAAPAPEAPQKAALPVEAPAAAVPLSSRPAAAAAGEGRAVASGAGETGSGQGAGGVGRGTGGGGQGAVDTPARRIAGALRDSDYPRAARSARLEGTVVIGFRVRTDGRVDRCNVVKSSGHAIFDDLTCRLFVERYRFQPATDEAGKPVETYLQTDFTWSTRRMR